MVKPTNVDIYSRRQRDYLDTFSGRMSKLVVSTKQRAAKKGIAHDLTKEQLAEIWKMQGGKCAMTGVDLELTAGTYAQRNPQRVSIDRVDSSGGYTTDNIQLVSCHYNLAKAAYTDDEFMDLIVNYIRHNNKLSEVLERTKSILEE